MAERHEYVSTACWHMDHPRCRKMCKLCSAPCGCSCHKPETEPSPYSVPGFPYVVMEPGRLSGAPAIRGRRVFADHAADLAISGGEAGRRTLQLDYGLTEAEIDCAVAWRKANG